MGETTNLGLSLFNYGVDLDQSFEEYQMNLSGSTTSNMTIIDNYVDTVSDLIVNYNTPASASAASASALITSYAGSVVTSRSASAALSGSFTVLYEFADSGIFDYNSISGSYSHLVMFGKVATAYSSTSLVNISCEFNGDSASSSYYSWQWKYSGSASSSAAVISGSETGSAIPQNGIVLGNVSGCASSGSFGGLFFAFVPNYSASGNFYKVAEGMSVTMIEKTNGNMWMSIAQQGGVWFSSSPITRIRIFGSVGGAHYNLLTGTNITVYGFK